MDMSYQMQVGYVSEVAFAEWRDMNAKIMNHAYWRDGRVFVKECTEVHGRMKDVLARVLRDAYRPHFLDVIPFNFDGLTSDVVVNRTGMYPVLAEVGYSRNWDDLRFRCHELLSDILSVQYVVLVKASGRRGNLAAEVRGVTSPSPLSEAATDGENPASLTIPPVTLGKSMKTPAITVDLRALANMMDAEGVWST
jgi:hypothetical protein